jgi:hypothetical protein
MLVCVMVFRALIDNSPVAYFRCESPTESCYVLTRGEHAWEPIELESCK